MIKVRIIKEIKHTKKKRESGNVDEVDEGQIKKAQLIFKTIKNTITVYTALTVPDLYIKIEGKFIRLK